MTDNAWLWIGFNVFVLAMLALDLGVFHRKAHIVSIRESVVWTLIWIALAMIFNLGIAHYMGSAKALEFFTGYVIEKSLSVDNIFVISTIFAAMAVPSLYQHRVLFWGVIGANAITAYMGTHIVDFDGISENFVRGLMTHFPLYKDIFLSGGALIFVMLTLWGLYKKDVFLRV